MINPAPRQSVNQLWARPSAACLPARRAENQGREYIEKNLKMADALGSVHLTEAAAYAVTPPFASAKSSVTKQTEVKGAPNSRIQSSRDFNTPPPKKIRVEDRRGKAKKLSSEGGVGGNGSCKEKLQLPTKQQQSYGSSAGLWGVTSVKTSSNNRAVPAAGGPQPPTNTHKVFKQNDAFLHKAPSSSAKPKDSSKDKQRENERGKGKGIGEEKKKHKQLLSSGPGSNVNNNNNNDISRFNNISTAKRENGEVMLPPKGRPPYCTYSLL